MNKVIDSLRMVEWAVFAAILSLIVWVIAPQQIEVLVYKLNIVSAAAYLGYWIDRRAFWYSRPGMGPMEDEWWMQLRRAAIMAATVVGGGLAL